jgi:hypothetical protein
MNVPVLESVRAAFAFQRLHWRTVGGVLAFAAAGATVQTAGDISGDSNLAMVGQIAYLLAICMGYAALMRLAFADENPGEPEFTPGRGGIQWGMPEWRLLGVGALLFSALAIAVSILIFAVILLSIVLGLSSKVEPNATPQQIADAVGPGGSAALLLVFAVFLGGMLYAAARLTLASAATVARRKVQVFSTWSLTKGQVLRVIAASLLSSLPSIAAGLLLAILVGLIGKPAGANAAPQVAMPLALIVAAVPAAILAFVQLPVSVGLTAYLYRGLRPAGEK